MGECCSNAVAAIVLLKHVDRFGLLGSVVISVFCPLLLLSLLCLSARFLRFRSMLVSRLSVREAIYLLILQ